MADTGNFEAAFVDLEAAASPADAIAEIAVQVRESSGHVNTHQRRKQVDWKMRYAMKLALLGKATAELSNGDADTAIAAADRVLRHGSTASPEIGSLAHSIRAGTHLRKGESAACVGDVAENLPALSGFGSISRNALNWLSLMAIGLGPERMRDQAELRKAKSA